MKHRKTKIMAMLLVTLLVLSLVACGGSSNPLVGKWVPEGEALEMFGGEELGMFGLDDGGLVLEFTKGGKVEMLLDGKPFKDFMKEVLIDFGMSKDEAEEMVKEFDLGIEYKVDGDKLQMIMKDGEDVETQEGTYKVDGKKLTITMDGETLTFTKK